MQIPNQFGKQEDVQITKEEFKKIEKAMKRPEFADLMGDYMKEISDPKNREEYDEYLKQLERENELPKDMKLIKPEPQFCLKTTIWSKSNKKHEQKFFLNICSSGVVEQPSSEEVTQNGQKGQNWRLPYAIGKIRYDQDQKGVICNTVDVAFHPYAIGYCKKMNGFQELICSTAIDASQKQLGERNEDISKDYKVLRKTKCKGGEPALLPIKVDKKGKVANQSEIDQRQGGLSNTQTKLQKDIERQKKEHQEQELLKQQQKKELEDEEDKLAFKESDEIDSKSVQQPKYRFIYSYPVDYADFIDSSVNPLKKLPTQLGCDIKMARVEGIKEINLDISNTSLILDVPEKYYLDIRFPYPVESENGTAKFEQKTKTLKLKIPISRAYIKQKLEDEKREYEEIQNKKYGEPEQENQQDNEESNSNQEKNYQIKFIQDQKVEKDQQQDVKIQEIASQEQQQQIQDQENENQIEEKVTEYVQLKYHLRQDNDFVFVIINYKGYDKDKLDVVFNSQEICVYSFLQQENNINTYFLHLTSQQSSMDTNQSEINYVTDFIVLKLKKLNQNDVVFTEQDYTAIPLNILTDKISQLKQDKLTEESEIPHSKSQSPPQNQKIQLNNEPDEDDEQPQQQATTKEIVQEKAAPEIQEQKIQQDKEILSSNLQVKQTVQFIDFKSILPHLFDID